MQFYFSEVDDDVLIIRADGGLNSENTDQFVNEIENLIKGGQSKIIVDCTRLDNITSYGLGVLVRLHTKMAKHGGSVKLACVKGLIKQLLAITRLNSIFEIYPDVNRARLMFQPKDGDL
jgi:anti-sigma B factor antagonist